MRTRLLVGMAALMALLQLVLLTLAARYQSERERGLKPEGVLVRSEPPGAQIELARGGRSVLLGRAPCHLQATDPAAGPFELRARWGPLSVSRTVDLPDDMGFFEQPWPAGRPPESLVYRLRLPGWPWAPGALALALLTAAYLSRGRTGPYRLVRLIGSGSGADVYAATRPGQPGLVAVKIFTSPPEPGRFQREVETTRRLEHPGIVRLLDVGTDYLVTELVEGTTLRALILPGGMPPERALELLDGLLEAVLHAHRQGVLHRDIKPENVLLDGNGRPRLTDFGLARSHALDPTLTRTGEVLGTPRYLAPELVTGPATERSDQYALGVVAYELLTGAPPFTGSDLDQLLLRQQTEDAPPTGKLSPELEAVLARMLARRPEDRFPDLEQARKAFRPA